LGRRRRREIPCSPGQGINDYLHQHLKPILPPSAAAPLSRHRQSMRRGPAAWGAEQFCRFSEGS
jgi:hypothetical protein